jgi:two-component system NarL family response regulator
MQVTRILVADDHIIVRDGLAALIDRQSDMKVVAEASDGAQAIAQYRQHRPHVALIDLRMPVVDGLAAIERVRAEFADAKLLVLTTYDGDEDIYQALRAGACGYLLKDLFREELLAAIRAVAAGGRYVPAPVAARLAERLPGDELSAREHEVLQKIVSGRSNRSIADELAISEGTVKTHVNHILAKLGVSDRTQAAVIALRRGLARLG